MSVSVLKTYPRFSRTSRSSLSVAPRVSRHIERSVEERTVGDDTVVDDGEFLEGVADVRVTVEGRGGSVSSPSSHGRQYEVA